MKGADIHEGACFIVTTHQGITKMSASTVYLFQYNQELYFETFFLLRLDVLKCDVSFFSLSDYIYAYCNTLNLSFVFTMTVFGVIHIH